MAVTNVDIDLFVHNWHLIDNINLSHPKCHLAVISVTTVLVPYLQVKSP